jgi:hypothetical protein
MRQPKPDHAPAIVPRWCHAKDGPQMTSTGASAKLLAGVEHPRRRCIGVEGQPCWDLGGVEHPCLADHL